MQAARMLSVALLVLGCPSSDDDGTTTHADTGGSTSAATSEAAASITGDAPEICEAYADHFQDCTNASDLKHDQAFGDCSAVIHEVIDAGDACLTATEAIYECLGGLDCASFEDQAAACTPERDAANAACGGGGGSSSDSGSTT